MSVWDVTTPILYHKNLCSTNFPDLKTGGLRDIPEALFSCSFRLPAVNPEFSFLDGASAGNPFPKSLV